MNRLKRYMYMEMKEMRPMKNKRIIVLLLCVILIALNTMDCEAQEVIGNGNIWGLEENIRLMKQDFLFLNEEIQRLRGECD